MLPWELRREESTVTQHLPPTRFCTGYFPHVDSDKSYHDTLDDLCSMLAIMSIDSGLQDLYSSTERPLSPQ